MRRLASLYLQYTGIGMLSMIVASYVFSFVSKPYATIGWTILSLVALAVVVSVTFIIFLLVSNYRSDNWVPRSKLLQKFMDRSKSFDDQVSDEQLRKQK